MNLGEARVRKERAFFVGTIRCGDVATARVRRKIKNVSITARRENNSITGMGFDFPSHETARDYSFGVAVHQDEIEHLGLRKHFYRVRGDLAGEGLVSAKQKLLARLAAGVKGSRNLGTAEGTIREQPAVFARERHAVLDTLVDDEITDFGEPVDLRFTGTEVTALGRVVK